MPDPKVYPVGFQAIALGPCPRAPAPNNTTHEATSAQGGIIIVSRFQGVPTALGWIRVGVGADRRRTNLNLGGVWGGGGGGGGGADSTKLVRL